MKYEVRGTYDMEALTYAEVCEMGDKVIEALGDRVEEYEDTIEALFNGRVATNEEIDKVAREFNIPYDYVENEGWFYVED